MSTPADLLNIGPGQNAFNVGIGRTSGHTDYTEAQIIAGYTSDPEFMVTPDGGAVQFWVSVAAKTTSANTTHPRSELRELNPDGSHAAWDGNTVGNVFQGVSRVTHVPPHKPWMCFSQIHDARSDLIRLQTEGSSPTALKLVARNTPPGSSKETVTTVKASYTLGDPVAWRYEVDKGLGKLFIDGVQVLTFPASEGGLYCKTGAYLQSNTASDSASEHGSVELLAGTLACVHGATNVPFPVPAPSPTPVPIPVPDPVPVPTPLPVPDPIPTPVPAPTPVPPVVPPAPSWWDRFVAWLASWWH